MGIGQIQGFSQFLVVIEHAVMRKRKVHIPGSSGEWMVVVIVLFITLCSHASVTHNSSRPTRSIEPDPVSRLRTFEYYDFSVLNIAYTRSISTALLSRICK